jgi:high-affinity iron transporter
VLFGLVGASTPALADSPGSAQTAWRLLDYIAVDYTGAVQDGRVVSAAEYAEMEEFSGQVSERIAGLPATSAKPALIEAARCLQAAVAARQDAETVEKLARRLGHDPKRRVTGSASLRSKLSGGRTSAAKGAASTQNAKARSL